MECDILKKELLKRMECSQEYFNTRVEEMDADEIKENATRIAARNEVWRNSRKIVSQLSDKTVELLLGLDDPIEAVAEYFSLGIEEAERRIQSGGYGENNMCFDVSEFKDKEIKRLKEQIQRIVPHYIEVATNDWLIRCRDLYKDKEYISNPYTDLTVNLFKISRDYDEYVLQEVYDRGFEYGIRPNELCELAKKIDCGMLIYDDLSEEFHDRINKEFQVYMKRIGNLTVEQAIARAEEISNMQQIYHHITVGEGGSENCLEYIKRIPNPLHAIASCYAVIKPSILRDLTQTLQLMYDNDLGIEYGIQSTIEQDGMQLC
jgi:hypothetical protein